MRDWSVAVRGVGVATALVMLVAMAHRARAEDDVSCGDCHAGADAIGPAVEVDGFAHSVHADIGCVGCHDRAEEVPHPDGMAPPDCATCHADEVEQYEESAHGRARNRGVGEAARCTDCHGDVHLIRAAQDPTSPVYPLNLPRTCGRCHGDRELAKRHGIPVEDAYQLYMDSIHGRAITRSGLLVSATCSSCHGAHDIRPAEDPASSVSRANVPATCGTCHAGVLARYRAGIHGRTMAAGDPKAPVCIDCHTAHQIRRVEGNGWKRALVRECGTCHVESLETYRDTFHGQVSALGPSRVAQCSDCHGAHDILPAADPGSRVNPAQLVATCGRCHPDANANFVLYDPHANPDDPARNPWLHVAALFMTGLLLAVMGFFGAHTILWALRSLAARRRGEASGRDEEGPR